jgi:hypothetical protein
MVELNFENFINEKLGIREDVIILSDFLYDQLKDVDTDKDVIINGKNAPKVSFEISKIFIKFLKYDYVASFDENRTKLTKNGFEIYLIFRKNKDVLKSIIYHELSHLIDHEIKLSKKIMNFKNEIASSKVANLLNNKKFNNLCDLIYLSDDGEIKSITHEFYEILTIGYKQCKAVSNKNTVFKHLIKHSNVKNLYDSMINYNIFKDLEDVPDKIKLKFFNDLINWNGKSVKIKKNRNNKFMIILKVISYIIYGYEKNIDLNNIMYKTQKHINMKGTKLRNNIHRLYGLLEKINN